MSALSLILAVAIIGAESQPVDFDTELIPIFTKAGCNVGSCHGARMGRGGFRLWLLGGDPEFDYQTVVRELEGRRINLAIPEESLLLLKPTGMVNHSGGRRLDPEGPEVKTILKWLNQGAPRVQRRKLVDFEIDPLKSVMEKLETTIPLKATAHFDDGTTEDVSNVTVFTATDPAAIDINTKTSEATVLRRGQNVVVARYLDRVIPMQLIVPLTEKPITVAEKPANYVDEYVFETLSTLRIPPSPLASDTTIVRRLYLDITGRLPTPDQVEAFLADNDPQKRVKLVDQLLQTPEFVDLWTYRFANLLRIRSKVFHDWLRTQLELGTGYDSMAQVLINAVGDTENEGPPNFYLTTGDPRAQAEYMSELFLGARLRCANCHNHPLDRWTQDDYHGFAAIFAKLERGRYIKASTRGEVTHPRTGEAAIPRIPGARFLEEGVDGRKAFADWLTESDNPYFARAVVNRLWKDLMGRGLIEPTDNLSETNPATHPALLQQLADDFVSHGFDLRHMIRTIAVSQSYNRSSESIPDNAGDDRFFSHATVRPLAPEVLADAMADVTGVFDQYGELPLGTRAVTLYSPKIESDALDILGRCARDESCEAASTSSGGLSAKLHMLNGALVNRKITDPDGRLAKWVGEGRSNEEVLDGFYLLCLGRPPSDAERSFWTNQLASTTSNEEHAQLIQDILWSLLSCREFATNH